MLSYKYNSAWAPILHVAGVLFSVCGKHASAVLVPLLKTVVELKEAIESIDTTAGGSTKTAEGSTQPIITCVCTIPTYFAANNGTRRLFCSQ